MSIRVGANALIVRDQKILLVKIHDESGPHYNLPGGGVEEGESLAQALKRECLEEIGAEVEVRDLVGAWEYVPHLRGGKSGSRQKVCFIFACGLSEKITEFLPTKPDSNQISVEWVKLIDLENPAESGRPPIFPPLEPFLLRAIREGSRAFFTSET